MWYKISFLFEKNESQNWKKRDVKKWIFSYKVVLIEIINYGNFSLENLHDEMLRFLKFFSLNPNIINVTGEKT